MNGGYEQICQMTIICSPIEVYAGHVYKVFLHVYGNLYAVPRLPLVFESPPRPRQWLPRRNANADSQMLFNSMRKNRNRFLF